MSGLIDQSEDKILAFSSRAMNEFCTGYGWMFDKNISCTLGGVNTMSADQLKKNFSGIIAVNSVDCAGPIDGRFKVVFDKSALFTLAGVIVMMPPPRVKENCARGTEEDASYVADAIGEVGNMLVGSFQKIFSEGVDGQEGFGSEGRMHLNLPVPVGCVDLNLDETVESFSVIVYELTVTGYDPFKIHVVFPQA